MVKPKVSKPISKNKKKPKEPSWKEKYMFLNSWRTDRASKDFIELLCGELLEYFSDSKRISITEFLCEKGINWDTFLKWAKDNQNLGDVYSQVKMVIGTRREKLAIYKEYGCNPNSIEKTLHKYDPVWKEVHDEDVKNAGDVQPVYNVIMEPLRKNIEEENKD